MISDVLSGDDRKGPGYIFLGHATQLDLDSVRYFNNQIASWSRMLAENEFEKINARRYIFDNLDQFDEPSELSNWMEDLESSNSTVSNFSLDDFGYSASDLDAIDVSMNSEASIWDDADFEPFFISFSGGGASYTSTVTKQSIKEQTRTRTLSSNSGGSLGIEASLNDIGFETSFGDMSTLTETRSQSQNSATSLTYSYTLSDEEETNMFLVAVIPGRGLNGPIFLNLGAITSCPYVAEDEAEFHEWYPALIPGLSNINPTMLDCESGTVQTPTWANTIDPNALVLEQSTGQVWYG